MFVHNDANDLAFTCERLSVPAPCYNFSLGRFEASSWVKNPAVTTSTGSTADFLASSRLFISRDEIMTLSREGNNLPQFSFITQIETGELKRWHNFVFMAH